MNDINDRRGGCEAAHAFIHFGDVLGTFTEQVTYNIIELTATIGGSLLTAWTIPFVRRWVNSMYNLTVALHGVAAIFVIIYWINTVRAMDQLKRTDNDNTGQIVSRGEGWIAAVCLPFVLLVHDQFVLDYKDHKLKK